MFNNLFKSKDDHEFEEFLTNTKDMYEKVKAHVDELEETVEDLTLKNNSIDKDNSELYKQHENISDEMIK